MLRTALLALLAAGCGDGFDYTATVAWSSQEVPDVQTVTFDGEPHPSGFSFVQSYDSFADAEQDHHTVTATTGSGTFAFDLVPTPCGGACGVYSGPCDEMVSETDRWILFRGTLAVLPDDSPLGLDADEGECTYGNGDRQGWAARK